jgi:6-phosphogluconolactonase
MKFGKVGPMGQIGPIGKVTLVSAIALLVATLFTACGTLNVGFLFVATNKQTPGQIEVYEVDSESGSLRTIPTSPFPSGGRNPIAEAVSPDALNLYAANGDDNNIVQFGIGTDGKLYPQSTVNTPGAFPLAVAVNSALNVLYVVDTLQPIAGCSLTNPCPGGIAGYAITPQNSTISPGSLGLAPAACSASTAPSAAVAATCAVGNAIINSNGQSLVPILHSPTDTTTVLTPTAINVLANGNYVYVTAYNAITNQGYLFPYSVQTTAPAQSTGPSLGALTPMNNDLPIPLGSEPVALASDSTSSFLYVVDKLQNRISTFSVTSGVPNLVATANSGNQPSALTLANNDSFLYVSNSIDANVTAYTVSSGNLTPVGTYASDVNPVAITTDPRHIGFLYTVNFLGNTLSGYQIDPTTGALINTKQSPYVSSVQPTAIAGIPHGGTATK